MLRQLKPTRLVALFLILPSTALLLPEKEEAEHALGPTSGYCFYAYPNEPMGAKICTP